LHPLTPYGATKAAAEMLLSAYTSSYALAGVALRLTNVYGPGMSGKDSIVPRLMRAARGGTTFDVYGDGQQIRDYVYVDDVVSAIVLSLRLNLTGTVVIGSGRSASVLQLVEFVQQVTGCHLPVRQVAAKAGEMREVSVETRRARSFGWLPTVDLREGLARVWQDWDVDAESIAFDERVA
jgi:UDP-glucose 4-epimerase